VQVAGVPAQAYGAPASPGYAAASPARPQPVPAQGIGAGPQGTQPMNQQQPAPAYAPQAAPAQQPHFPQAGAGYGAQPGYGQPQQQPPQQQPQYYQQPQPQQWSPSPQPAPHHAPPQQHAPVQHQMAPQAMRDPFAAPAPRGQPQNSPLAATGFATGPSGGGGMAVPLSANPPAPPAPGGDTPVIPADLGAQSSTNFYKGLSGNDIIDHGGLFVSTYMIPKIGTPVRLKVSLPGGYEFEANAIVRWAREQSDGSDAPPGFGAQFTAITPEARQLVYRYVRNREPLFHDDL